MVAVLPDREPVSNCPPRKQLWPILSALTRDLAALPYGERLARLLGHAFGLWDVLGACEREGRLDSAIRGLAIDFARTCDAQLCTEA
ncbi:MAG: hypothetical protein JWP34_1511 [Massilia sp.]|nr:hypothetical protein [Massilia sp.]